MWDGAVRLHDDRRGRVAGRWIVRRWQVAPRPDGLKDRPMGGRPYRAGDGAKDQTGRHTARPVAFTPSPAAWPPRDDPVPDARLTDLFSPGEADLHLAGVPTDVAVIGRRGAREGPTGIRQAMRFIGGHDTTTGRPLRQRIRDHGDVAGLDSHGDDVLEMHGAVRAALRPVFGDGRAIILGGDHGLTYAHVGALADAVEGSIGIVVIDAHYDLRAWEGQPTSGTPFRRILEEFDGRVQPQHVAEIGIRPHANAPSLADYADQAGIHIHPMHAVRRDGIEAVTAAAMEAMSGVEHIWLSIDIDGLDQSVASGCSAPGAGGLWFHEAEHVVRTVAADPRCRGMDVLEVAPGLDPTGNTCRSAAQLVGTFVGQG